MKREIHTMSLPVILALFLTACGTSDNQDSVEDSHTEDVVIEDSETVAVEDPEEPTIEAEEQTPKETVGKDSSGKSQKDIQAMDDEKTYPGTTKDGQIDDADAIYNAITAYYEVMKDPKGARPDDKEAEVFHEYAVEKNFNLTDKEKAELFTTAKDLGMFRGFNYKALNDDDKYNIISTALASKVGASDEDAPEYDVKIQKDDIKIDNSGKLPKAFIPAENITLAYDDGDEFNLAENNIDDNFDGFHFVRYKGIWYISKESVSDAPRGMISMFGAMLQDESFTESSQS